MASLDKILRFVIVDTESKQTIAAFATESEAVWYVDSRNLRTRRGSIIVRYRDKSWGELSVSSYGD